MAAAAAEMTFEEAAKAATALARKPDNNTLLKLYGLYKQGTVGDVNIGQPWAVQMEARAKWDAWNANKGMKQDDAKKAYVAMVVELKKTNS